MRNIANRPDLFCINTGTLGYQFAIEDTIKACGELGIGWISPWRSELEGKDLKKIKEILDDNNVKVSSLCRSTYYTAPTQELRQKAIDENKRALDMAAQLDATCYMQVVGSLYPGLKDLSVARAQVKEGIAQMLEHSKDVGVPLTIEPLHPMTTGDRSCVTTLKEAIDLSEELDPTGKYHLGVTIDVYHVWWDAALFEQIKRAGDLKRILAFHVSDWKLDTADLVNDRGMPGEGCIDIKAIRNQVEQTGFDGPVEIEVFSKEHWWKKSLNEILSASILRISKYC